MLIYKIVSWSSLPACTDVLTLIEEHIHFDAFPQIIHKKAPEITSGNNSVWRFLRHGFLKAAVSFIRRKRELGVFELK